MQPYYAKKSKSKKSFIKWILILLILAFWPQIKVFVSPFIKDITSKYFIKTNTGVWYDLNLYIQDRNNLKDSIKKLNIDNIDLENKITILEHQLDEYNLKQIENETGSIDSVIAYSLGNKDSLIYDSFIINVGYRNGVKDGAIVYTRGRQPVGTISEIHNSNSTVKLLSSEGNEVTGILDSGHEKINMTGNGGGEYITKVKNSLITNKVNDIHNFATTTTTSKVSDSGITLGSKVYYGDDVSMTIGEIVNIEKQKDEDMSTIHIRGHYNPSTQTIFFVDK